jgi:hypothetical protein
MEDRCGHEASTRQRHSSELIGSRLGLAQVGQSRATISMERPPRANMKGLSGERQE